MCFSAGASFTAGSVLAVIGVACVRKARTPSQILFTAIPFLFAVQQLIEGYLWLSLKDPVHETAIRIATNTFLTFAQILWPLWVPLSIMLVEKVRWRRQLLLVVTFFGILIAVHRAYFLMFHTAHAAINGYHISYEIDGSETAIGIGSFFYFICTVAPSFLSSVRKMWIIAVLILFSFIVTRFYFEQYLISVWCFFSAVISFLIYIIAKEEFSDPQLKK